MEGITKAQARDICIAYRHDFGLLDPVEQENLELKCHAWFEAIRKVVVFEKLASPDEPVRYGVEVGDPCFDYQVGNYINAVEMLTKFYIHGHGTGILNNEAADALEMYAKHIRQDD